MSIEMSEGGVEEWIGGLGNFRFLIFDLETDD